MTEKRLDSRSSEWGFALVSVLLVLGVIASLLVMLQSTTRSMASGIEAEIRMRQARHLADAGLARIAAALDNPEDGMLAQLRETRAVRWKFDGQDVDLSLISESGKIDLNASDPELIRNAAQLMMGDRARAQEIYRDVLARRAKGSRFVHPFEILHPQERLGPLANTAREMFTVLTGARGIDPLRASTAVLKAVPGIGERELKLLEDSRREASLFRNMRQLGNITSAFSAERPVYTLRAALTVPTGGTVVREAIVLMRQDDPKVVVVAWGSVIPPMLSTD